MEFHSMTFFEGDDAPIKVHFKPPIPEDVWKDTVIINTSKCLYDGPSISFHFRDESGLIALKNEFIWAFESYLRRKNGKVG